MDRNQTRSTSANLLVRPFLGICVVIAAAMMLTAAGCGSTSGDPANSTMTWGQRGLGDGRFERPRAIAIDRNDRIYIVDMTARIQVFDLDGNFITKWRTPEFKMGKPCGLSISNDGLLMVADTHYHRVLFYTPDGQLVPSRTIGGTAGRGPGEFGFVTEAVQDSQGNYYVGEYGDYDRIQKFDPTGKFLLEWGGHGDQPGEFLRPQGLLIDEYDRLWVADVSNHRIQVFDVTGDDVKLVKVWGEQGTELGQLRYPYNIVFDGQGHIYVCEFGNHRVQKFTLDGQSLGSWGGPGRQLGQLYQPWGICFDRRGMLYVLDSYNHRIQRVDCDRWDWMHAKVTSEPTTHGQ